MGDSLQHRGYFTLGEIYRYNSLENIVLANIILARSTLVQTVPNSQPFQTSFYQSFKAHFMARYRLKYEYFEYKKSTSLSMQLAFKVQGTLKRKVSP